jgi:D-3-phosphoglycerate dehydrogenase
MSPEIAVTTSSFADEHLKMFAGRGVGVRRNILGRTLKQEELVEIVHGCVGVIAGTEKYDSTVLSRLGALKVISRCGAGIDNVDLSAAQKLGIEVLNTPDAPTRAVAELVIALSLDLLRHVSDMDRQLRQGRWTKKMGRLFAGKEFGVIGLGRIGTEVAKLATALGANVSYADIKNLVGNKGLTARNLKELLTHADIISIHIPWTSETSHLIGTKEIALMKPEALLIQCSRGGIIDEEALYKALKEERIGGAALDVFHDEPYQGPLTQFDQVILTPHIGSYAHEARTAMEIEAAQNLIKALSEGRVI